MGLSDHSREPLIAPLGAVALGAKVIEKHFTTDNNHEGPDHIFAVLPEELHNMIRSIRDLEKALGVKEKTILEEEKELHSFARRSVYAIQDIEEGEILSKENTAILRSGNSEKGILPENAHKLYGKKSNTKILSGQPILEGAFDE